MKHFWLNHLVLISDHKEAQASLTASASLIIFLSHSSPPSLPSVLLPPHIFVDSAMAEVYIVNSLGQGPAFRFAHVTRAAILCTFTWVQALSTVGSSVEYTVHTQDCAVGKCVSIALHKK